MTKSATSDLMVRRFPNKSWTKELENEVFIPWSIDGCGFIRVYELSQRVKSTALAS